MPNQVQIYRTDFFLKNGKEADWNRVQNFIPGKGEPIIFLVDETHEYPRMKIGDGETVLEDLPFLPIGKIPGFDPNNIVAKKVEHALTFGMDQAYRYDGSADVTVPVYMGEVHQ